MVAAMLRSGGHVGLGEHPGLHVEALPPAVPQKPLAVGISQFQKGIFVKHRG